jgi:hypothetical protein
MRGTMLLKQPSDKPVKFPLSAVVDRARLFSGLFTAQHPTVLPDAGLYPGGSSRKLRAVLTKPRRQRIVCRNHSQYRVQYMASFPVGLGPEKGIPARDGDLLD